MAYEIDESSITLARCLKDLRKKYPHVDQDLAAFYKTLVKAEGRFDRSIPNAHAVPGYDGLVWKFRCNSTDMRRGSSGGFRVLAAVAGRRIVPFCIFTKEAYAHANGQQPSAAQIKVWLAELRIGEPNDHDAADTASI